MREQGDFGMVFICVWARVIKFFLSPQNQQPFKIQSRYHPKRESSNENEGGEGSVKTSANSYENIR